MKIRHAYHERAGRSKHGNIVSNIAYATRLLRIADNVLNFSANRKISNYLREDNQQAEAIWSEQMELRHESFISSCCKFDVTVPNQNMFTWWREYPWLASPGSEIRELNKRYYFTVMAAKVQTRVLEVRIKEKTIGLAICTMIDGVVKTPYIYCLHAHGELFFEVLYRSVISSKRYHTLISFHPGFIEFLGKRTLPIISYKKKIRYSGYSNTLDDSIGEVSFQDGDGDYIFT